MIPLIVEEPSLSSANALLGMARQASLLIGPAVASILYGVAGSTVVFGFNSVSYLASFAFVYATRPRSAETGARRRERSGRSASESATSPASRGCG